MARFSHSSRRSRAVPQSRNRRAYPNDLQYYHTTFPSLTRHITCYELFSSLKDSSTLRTSSSASARPVVLIGALFKIQSWPYASELLTIGLLTEAGLFFMLGVLGPEKDYYWEKLYPGLDDYTTPRWPRSLPARAPALP